MGVPTSTQGEGCVTGYFFQVLDKQYACPFHLENENPSLALLTCRPPLLLLLLLLTLLSLFELPLVGSGDQGYV